MNEDTYIWIFVNTHGINQKNKNSKIILLDNHGDNEKPGDPKDYVSIVWENKNVYWMAVPSPFQKDPGPVILEKIEKKDHGGGSNILKKGTNIPGSDGRISGKVVDNKVTGLESYNIFLSINGDQYVIDPKLEMHP